MSYYQNSASNSIGNLPASPINQKFPASSASPKRVDASGGGMPNTPGDRNVQNDLQIPFKSSLVISPKGEGSQNPKYLHSRSQSHNNTPSPPLFQPVRHDQFAVKPLYDNPEDNSQFHFNNAPTQPNWTSLIPPMPSKPQTTYRPEAVQTPKNQNIQSQSYKFQQQMHHQLPQSQPKNQINPNQRHSIAISSNRNDSQMSSREMAPREMPYREMASRDMAPREMASRNIQPYQNTLASPYVPTKKFDSPSSAAPPPLPLNLLNQSYNPNHQNIKQIQGQNQLQQNPKQIQGQNQRQTQNQDLAPLSQSQYHSQNVSQSSQNQTNELNQLQSNSKSVRRKTKKVCKKCGLEITGQFVRALNSAFHVECFCCHECDKQCSAKFFPYDITDASGAVTQVALCEYDYFKKLDLICFNCNNALRGPYITALGNKYHLEHFKCAVCQKVFESDESYYEHASIILCHYHYSRMYASHCEGCNSSIVKQFVELFRGGRNQQWHPECYMVHKFWNVCIMADSVGLQDTFSLPESTVLKLRDLKNQEEEPITDDINPKLLISIEQQIENVVMKSWLTLSGYDETTASCISDMLLNACTSDQAKGLLATGRLIIHVEILFKALDFILKLCQKSTPLLKEKIQSKDDSEDDTENEYFQQLKKEPRNISGKIMSYLAILRKSKQISKSGSLSAELLSVITGCAHYLKLLIRAGLSNSLKLNKLLGTTEATDNFLNLTSAYEKFNNDHEGSTLVAIRNRLEISSSSTDACTGCLKSIEKSCILLENKRWHLKCFVCSNCQRTIPVGEINETCYTSTISCKNCVVDTNRTSKFEVVSDLSQLVYLLKIALSRSCSVMQIDSSFEMVSSDIIEEDSRIEELNMDDRNATEDNYSQTLTDVTRLRTRRQNQKLSNSIKQKARKSVILDAPEANRAKQDQINPNTSEELDETNEVIGKELKANRKASSASHFSFISSQNNDSLSVKQALNIRDEPQRQLTNGHLDRTSDLLKNEKSLTLDDIPRIVAAEQARDQRPNAFKHHNSLYQRQNNMQPIKVVNKKNNNPSISPSNVLDSILNAPQPSNSTKRPKYYSELTKDEHFIMRHIAVEALIQISSNRYNKEELLASIQTKKQGTFWDKFKFGDGKKDRNMGVFGVDLQDLTKKYGIDSDLGMGPSKLRIPIVIDDVINALRQKDMSVEGIFRLNGNIKKLRELTEEINKSPLKSPDFTNQNAVQLAALMKKWLRELPNPLLTYSLYDIWISSQRETNTVRRKRILQLAYCMLPRSHRNLVEVLLYFFSWVASFAEIDEETGSKMDIHNLATVIAPNILLEKPGVGPTATPQSGDTYFLAIEVLNQMIECHEELGIIPDDLLEFFEKCGFSKDENLSSKEVVSVLDKFSKEDSVFFQNYEKMSAPDGPSNQMVHSNTISRGQFKIQVESRGETLYLNEMKER